MISNNESSVVEKVFSDLSADSDVDRLHIIPSLCMNCYEEGETRLLPTRIPYFREIILMSFQCPHCNAQSSEVQPAAEIQEKASRHTIYIDAEKLTEQELHDDLNRQIIRSNTASISIPELDFEIPPQTQGRGEINTMEGFLENIADSLEGQQANRLLQDEEVHNKIQVIIDAFKEMQNGKRAFTFIIEDLAGNSFIENPYAPAADPRVTVTYFERTHKQTEELGYAVEEQQAKQAEDQKAWEQLMKDRTEHPGQYTDDRVSAVKVSACLNEKVETYFNISDRAATIPGQCPGCKLECETRLCVTDLPHFKDVALMTTDCNQCGYRDVEVKPMGSISEKGVKISLKVTCLEDLKRDLLKSETSGVMIPELELELARGTLGGKYTTLEGILEDIEEQLTKSNPFSMGDSSDSENKVRFGQFLTRLKGLTTMAEPFTFILDDPLGNCYIYSEVGPENDASMSIERYTRSFEQDEELGLNDINVDNYLEDEEDKKILAAEIEKDRLEAEQTSQPLKEKNAQLAEEKQQAEDDKKKHFGKVGGRIRIGLQEELQKPENEHTGNCARCD